MSGLLITHSTVYRYSEPVRFGLHRLVVRPREGHDLRVEGMKLEISPAHEVAWMRDVFGNSVALVEFFKTAAELSITSEVLIRRHAAFPGRARQTAWAATFPVVYDPLESAVAAAYRATTYGDDAQVVRDFLEERGVLLGARRAGEETRGAEEILDRINRLLYETIVYNRRPERGTQSPSETLTAKTGSCRDIATLMMEGCRSLGIAARFASGYLDCPASAAGRASTHAWVEAYLPPHGWVGFDPTLGERTSYKHIPCGLSNHPRGVMPVSGAYTPTATSRYLGMEVRVKIEKPAHDNSAATHTK